MWGASVGRADAAQEPVSGYITGIEASQDRAARRGGVRACTSRSGMTP